MKKLGTRQVSGRLCRKAKDTLMELYANTLIGGCYCNMGKYAEASQILKRNVQKALEIEYPLLAMSSLSPLLSTYQLWNKKDSVRMFLKKGERTNPSDSGKQSEQHLNSMALKPACTTGLENFRKVSTF